jgi:hypothetical protein
MPTWWTRSKVQLKNAGVSLRVSMEIDLVFGESPAAAEAEKKEWARASLLIRNIGRYSKRRRAHVASGLPTQ